MSVFFPGCDESVWQKIVVMVIERSEPLPSASYLQQPHSLTMYCVCVQVNTVGDWLDAAMGGIRHRPPLKYNVTLPSQAAITSYILVRTTPCNPVKNMCTQVDSLYAGGQHTWLYYFETLTVVRPCSTGDVYLLQD
jgi:hypothetical protein